MVYIGWASRGDNDPYHGWIMGYDARTLKQKTIFNASHDGLRAPIFLGGAGPAADSAGNLYTGIGNGTFDAPLGGSDWGDSILKLRPSQRTLQVTDYFTPHDEADLLRKDQDLGSGGVMLLPDQADSHKHLLLEGGKNGKFYLVDRDNMGQFHLDRDAVVQVLSNVADGEEIFVTPTYFNQTIYVAPLDGHLQALRISNGKITETPTSQSKTTFGYPGATVSVSANGSRNGIVWAIERKASEEDGGEPSGAAILHAYDASNPSHELFNSSLRAADAAGLGIKFTVPTIADGKVFVGAADRVTVYGLKTGANA